MIKMIKGLCLISILNLCDIITTYIILQTPFGKESNPIAKYGFDTIGFIPTSIIKLLVVGLVSIYAYHHLNKREFKFSIVIILTIFTVVIINNLWIIYLISKA